MHCGTLSLLTLHAFMLNQNPFLLCRDLSDNACTSSTTCDTSSTSCDVVAVEPPPAKKPKTLMDFTYSETLWPRSKNADQVTYLDKYSCDYASNLENSIRDLNNYIKNCKILAKVLHFDCLLILFKKHCNRVFAQNVQTFESLCQAVRDLLWYVGPQNGKLEVRAATIPSFFDVLLPFNDYKHKLERLSEEVILKLANAVTNLLESLSPTELFSQNSMM